MPSSQARPFALMDIVNLGFTAAAYGLYLFGRVLYTHNLGACCKERKVCHHRCIRWRRYCTTPISTFIAAHAEQAYTKILGAMLKCSKILLVDGLYARSRGTGLQTLL
jgi:hypothetical protein